MKPWLIEENSIKYLNIQNDKLLLGDAFKNFRKMCLKISGSTS